jgi:hypothetical protein
MGEAGGCQEQRWGTNGIKSTQTERPNCPRWAMGISPGHKALVRSRRHRRAGTRDKKRTGEGELPRLSSGVEARLFRDGGHHGTTRCVACRAILKISSMRSWGKRWASRQIYPVCSSPSKPTLGRSVGGVAPMHTPPHTLSASPRLGRGPLSAPWWCVSVSSYTHTSGLDVHRHKDVQQG